MASTEFGNVISVNNGDIVQAAEDDRSSSLSDLGDRAGIERSSLADSEANDTEAETERLEDSPQKQRRQRDVVLTSTNSSYSGHHNQPVAGVLPEKSISLGESS